MNNCSFFDDRTETWEEKVFRCNINRCGTWNLLKNKSGFTSFLCTLKWRLYDTSCTFSRVARCSAWEETKVRPATDLENTDCDWARFTRKSKNTLTNPLLSQITSKPGYSRTTSNSSREPVNTTETASAKIEKVI